jgi:hypothetical protein
MNKRQRQKDSQSCPNCRDAAIDHVVPVCTPSTQRTSTNHRETLHLTSGNDSEDFRNVSEYVLALPYVAGRDDPFPVRRSGKDG